MTLHARQVRELADRMGVAVEDRPIDAARPHVGSFIALTAPDGRRFRSGPQELLCDDWSDALERLSADKLIGDSP